MNVYSPDEHGVLKPNKTLRAEVSGDSSQANKILVDEAGVDKIIAALEKRQDVSSAMKEKTLSGNSEFSREIKRRSPEAHSSGWSLDFLL
jgi:hypothetical protein